MAFLESQFLAIGFLAPGFLVAGAVLAGVPIVIHFLNRRRYKIVPWAAMEFLLAAIKKNRRRLRFESWLLLATRCAVLVLLGLALARPMGCASSSMASLGQRASLNVFIIDNSYSMGYRFARGTARTHLDQAKVIAREMISRLQAGTEGVVLLTAAAPAGQPIARPTYDLTAASAAIDAIHQTDCGTDLSGAIQEAISIGRQSKLPDKQLYIVTDSTRSALDLSQAADLRELGRQVAGEYHITYFNLGQPHQENLSISGLHPSAHLVTTKFNTALLASLNRYNATGATIVDWKLDGRSIGTSQAAPGDGSKPVDLENVAISTGGPHVLSATVDAGDPLPVDNTCYRVIQAVSQLKVLLVEGDRGSGPMAGSASFLNVALAPSQQPSGPRDSYVQPETISDLQLSNQVLSDYRAVVLANVPTVAPRQADALADYVRHGGTLILFMGELVNAENYNQVLLPRGLMPGALVRRMTAPADSSGFRFDFHPGAPLNPLLQFLQNQPRSGLDTTQITTYWKVEMPANSKVERVLNYQGLAAAQSNSGSTSRAVTPSSEDPAITLQSVGAGRVLFVSTTADAQWTTLPAKPVYVPLMHEMLQGSIVPENGWMNLNVGQRLVVPSRIKLTSQPTLITPDGIQIPLEIIPPANTYQSSPLMVAGVYQLKTGIVNYPVVVNLPAEEADVRTEPPAAIREIFGGVPIDIEADQPPPEAAQATNGRDFGWIAMIVLFGLIGAECFMAMRFGHYKKPGL